MNFLRRLCSDVEKHVWMQMLMRSDWIPGVGVRAWEEKCNPSRNKDFKLCTSDAFFFVPTLRSNSIN